MGERNSRIPNATVEGWWKAYPNTMLDNGNLRTGPLRLGFVHLFKPQEAMEAGKPDKYAATLLFPWCANLDVIRVEMGRAATEKWADKAATFSLHNPLKDQQEKAQYDGFVPGEFCITATGERQPPLVDQNLAPLTNKASLYPGVWAMCTIRVFTFETRHPQSGAVLKRGIGWGLQSVMKIADDNEQGGGGSDPNADFAGVSIGQEVNPAAMFGTGTTAGGAAPAAVDPASLF